jgi:chromosome segregation ATPase
MMRTTGCLAMIAAIAMTMVLGGCVSQDEYDHCYNRLVKTQDELHQKTVKVENLQSDLEQAQSRNQTLSKKIESADKEKAEAVDAVRGKLVAAQKEAGELQKSLNEARGELKSAEKNNEKMLTAMKSQKAATTEATTLLKQTQDDLAKAKAEIAGLRKKVSDLQEQLADAETRAAQAEKKLKEAQGDDKD